LPQESVGSTPFLEALHTAHVDGEVHHADAQPAVYAPPVDEARAQISELISRYAELIDVGDFEGVASLLATAELSFEGFDTVRRGRDEIRATYEASTRRYEDGTPRTKHLVTNVVVDIEPTMGTASSRSYFTVLQAVPGALALQPVVAGRYRDGFRSVDGTWRFSRRHIMVDLTGDLGHHLLFGLEG
jgi:3-phenylpropionate/cinnamic acid dioxygenase small subunit